MKQLIASAIFLCFMASCSLTSVTMIKPNDAFVLGNNQHGSFTVKLKNLSDNDVKLWQVPVEGGQHSPLIVRSRKKAKVHVGRNTALRIENDSRKEASVELIVTGDIGLSMGYKNQ
jgi:hypothetical protein